MSWSQIADSFSDLIAARRRGRDLKLHWARFAATVRASVDDPPLHLRLILQALARVEGKPNSDIQILDHGCGSGRTLICLMALGYEGVHGVDIGGDCEDWNRVLNDELGLPGKRFIAYDGGSLPLPDRKFDFVFSQQVVEHVRPQALENDYSEERRVMRPGAIAYHQVPHRLVPYDSHTRTWLIHYLPRPLCSAFCVVWGAICWFRRLRYSCGGRGCIAGWCEDILAPARTAPYRVSRAFPI